MVVWSFFWLILTKYILTCTLYSLLQCQQKEKSASIEDKKEKTELCCNMINDQTGITRLPRNSCGGRPVHSET
jgi:hypothetical protein